MFKDRAFFRRSRKKSGYHNQNNYIQEESCTEGSQEETDVPIYSTLRSSKPTSRSSSGIGTLENKKSSYISAGHDGQSLSPPMPKEELGNSKTKHVKVTLDSPKIW